MIDGIAKEPEGGKKSVRAQMNEIWKSKLDIPGKLLVKERGSAMSQQQYANAYAFWDFGNNTDDIYNIDQQIWIAQTAPGSYWALVWSFVDATTGGYMGLQIDEDGTTRAIFSLWDATAARSGQCAPFGGEGIGYNCKLPFTIQTDRFYRLRVWNVASDNGGHWWGGWVIEQDQTTGKLMEHLIGEIQVPYNLIKGGTTIMNFSEFLGDAVAQCSNVPMSICGFTPPAANYNGAGTGSYRHYSKFNGGSNPSANPCQTGNESSGALLTVANYDYGFAEGALVFLGGTKANQVLTPPDRKSPPDMPNS